jgi:hypothetical protein
METYSIIKGYPNYEISDLGNVRNVKTKRVIKLSLNRKGGYLKIHLRNDKKCISKLVHRLVAETYINNEFNNQQVDHIDRNRLNNKKTNLRWVSQEDNLINRSRLSDKQLIYYCDYTDVFIVKSNGIICSYNNINDALEHFKKLF